MGYKKYLIWLVLIFAVAVGAVGVSQFNIFSETANQLGAVSAAVNCLDQDRTPSSVSNSSNDPSFYTASYASFKGIFGKWNRRYDKKVNGKLSEAYCDSASSRSVSYKDNINCDIPSRAGFVSRSFGDQTAWACKRATNTCSDTDNGIDITQKGTVTANGTSYTDYCDEKKVFEYSCSSRNTKQERSYSCPGIMVDGRVRFRACQDGACAILALLPAPMGLIYNNANHNLTWNPVPGAYGYSYRYFNGNRWSAQVGLTTNSFTLDYLQIGTGFKFEISTLNFAGERSSPPAIFYVP